MVEDAELSLRATVAIFHKEKIGQAESGSPKKRKGRAFRSGSAVALGRLASFVFLEFVPCPSHPRMPLSPKDFTAKMKSFGCGP